MKTLAKLVDRLFTGVFIALALMLVIGVRLVVCVGLPTLVVLAILDWFNIINVF